ncbi:hypothetical protein [Brumimicrobium oceani]|uniref:Uncharacterized protein n=1 Tax=Brumimicrobium oceani TaxID=2100725 RepID=A0A2U2X0X0_9FLAO|nr:hypothetical protein [Brumimicrobium oceani]PWH81435.1 hypothetical protein DIT68_14975 [Brumimicrobium oceani]
MKHIITLFILSLFVSSCTKEQPDVAWLKIDKWILNANPNAENPQGEMSHDISQVFVNMDGKSLGAYELPAKIPIIGDGLHDFVLIPGVVNNGISATKKRYPFLEQYKGSIEIKRNDTVSFTPTTQYYNSIKFLIEDFESPSMQVDVAPSSTATLGRNDDPEFLKWGNKYGEIILKDSTSKLSFVTTFGTVLPKLGTEVYLEFDYINTNSMLTSVISYGNDEYFVDEYILINPQTKEEAVWKHAYLDLKEIVSFRQTTPLNDAEFKFVLDPELSSSYFYIDNIKLVYP